MKRKNIYKLLIDRDMTLAQLARRVGRHYTMVWLVVNGRKVGEPTRILIAEALDVPYQELWGKRA